MKPSAPLHCPALAPPRLSSTFCFRRASVLTGIASTLLRFWLWHAGSPIRLRLSPDGRQTEVILLGPGIKAGERPQAIVPTGVWQSAESTGAWSLVSCVVAPAFEFGGFTLAPPGWRPGMPLTSLPSGRSASTVQPMPLGPLVFLPEDALYIRVRRILLSYAARAVITAPLCLANECAALVFMSFFSLVKRKIPVLLNSRRDVFKPFMFHKALDNP